MTWFKLTAPLTALAAAITFVVLTGQSGVFA